MPALVAWIGSMLERYAGAILIQALVSIGLTFVTYKFSVAPIRQWLVSHLAGMPQMAIEVLGFLGVDKCVTLIISAYAARMAVAGASRLVRSPKAG